MEVTVPNTLNVLNGSDARLPCTFNSCYTVNHKQFSLNWTYQECNNCSEEMVSPGMVAGDWGRRQEAHSMKPLFPTTCPCLGRGLRHTLVGCLLPRASAEVCCHTWVALGGQQRSGGDCLPSR